MKEKTARRFMARNLWKIASAKIHINSQSPSFWKRVREAKRALGNLTLQRIEW
jgi:hypothetical protein